jgi:hypothetical protein
MAELTSMRWWLSTDLDGWRFQHVSSGMRHGHIRHPEGQPPTPYGCRWCGTEHHRHGLQYLRERGGHRWGRPTDAQILARMRARREAWKATCRCVPPEEQRPMAPVVNPWRCEADDCVMVDRLLGMWMTPLSADRAAALMGGASC